MSKMRNRKKRSLRLAWVSLAVLLVAVAGSPVVLHPRDDSGQGQEASADPNSPLTKDSTGKYAFQRATTFSGKSIEINPKLFEKENSPPPAFPPGTEVQSCTIENQPPPKGDKHLQKIVSDLSGGDKKEFPYAKFAEAAKSVDIKKFPGVPLQPPPIPRPPVTGVRSLDPVSPHQPGNQPGTPPTLGKQGGTGLQSLGAANPTDNENQTHKPHDQSDQNHGPKTASGKDTPDSPDAPINAITKIASQSGKIQQNLLAEELLKSSRRTLNKYVEANRKDEQVIQTKAFETLSQPKNQDPKGLLSLLDDTRKKLAEESKKFAAVTSGVDSGDIKHQLIARTNADQLLQNTTEKISNLLRDPSKSLTNLANTLGFQKPAGAGKNQVLTEQARKEIENTLFEKGDGPSDGPNRGLASNSASSLVNRTLGLSLLSPQEQKLLIQKLKLVERKDLTLSSGETFSALLVHAGYIFGGAKSAVDCSSFVSMVMPNNFSKARLTTLDLLAIWKYKTDGYFPNPPSYASERADTVRKLAQAFSAVNIYHEDQVLIPGDLLVYRIPGIAVGHVLVVESYDPIRYVATVVEAAQSAGTIRRREYYLSQHVSKRIFRPGLLVLRLKPTNNSACRYTASAGNGGKK